MPLLLQDQLQADQLYCLAICHRRDVACLRDLTANDLGLLQNIRDKGSEVVADFGTLKRHLEGGGNRVKYLTTFARLV